MDQIHLMYATRLLRDPAAIYRQIDVAGRAATADGPALVQLLYEELVAALRAAAHAVEHRQYAIRSDRVTRATAILFALEAGLDFTNGNALSATLARLYAGARATVLDAAMGDDPAPFRAVATTLADIASAWATARAA